MSKWSGYHDEVYLEEQEAELDRLRVENDILTKGYDEECNNTRDALTEIYRRKIVLGNAIERAEQAEAENATLVATITAIPKQFRAAEEAAALSMRDRVIAALSGDFDSEMRGYARGFIEIIAALPLIEEPKL